MAACTEQTALPTSTGAGIIPNTAAASANVLQVPRDYSTIQAAVAAAVPGNLVLVQGGAYTGIISVPPAVTLRGVAGATLTGTVHLASGASLEGFRIIAAFESQGVQPVGVGVSGVSITNNTIDAAGRLRAIWLPCTGCTVKNNDLSGGRSDGIAVVGSGNDIRNNTIHDNPWGIVMVPGAANNTVRENRLSNNSLCDIVDFSGNATNVFKNNKAACQP